MVFDNVSVTSWVLENLEFVAFVRKCDRKFAIGVKFEVILVSFLCRKNTISLREKIWVYKAGLTLPLFIEVPVTSKDSQRSSICLLGVSILPFSKIGILELFQSVVFFVVHFIAL
jgi:hypothetical protein